MAFNKRKYNAEYYKKHKEQYKEYRKTFYRRHKDRILEKARKYYQEHKQQNLEYTKRWINKSEENKKKYLQSIYKSRQKRVDKLREQGCKNAWQVVLKGHQPKYKVCE